MTKNKSKAKILIEICINNPFIFNLLQSFDFIPDKKFQINPINKKVYYNYRCKLKKKAALIQHEAVHELFNKEICKKEWSKSPQHQIDKI